MENIILISADEYQTSERFYALPKILFESDLYKEMRLDAKVFYAVLKDRLTLDSLLHSNRLPRYSECLLRRPQLKSSRNLSPPISLVSSLY